MNIRLVVVAILLLASNGKCQAKKLLCLMGVGTESADKWNKVLMKDLSNKGHDLTIITTHHSLWQDADDDDGEWSNVEFIYLENTQNYLQQRYEKLTSNEMLEQSIWKYIIHWYDRQMATCRGNLESVGFSEVLHLALKEKRQYDAILYDVTYGPGCLLHLAYLWKQAPIIGITSGHLNADILSMSRKTIMKPSLDPYMLSDFPTNMNYWKRLQNTALYAFDYCYREWIVRPVIEGMWSKNMHSKNFNTPTSLDNLIPRFKVILANYHPSLHSLQTLPINIIPVAGLQQEPLEAMAKEYLEFIENTQLEVIPIVMNMNKIGSNLIQQIVEVIQAFPNNGFIWVRGDASLLGRTIPKNLHLANEEQLQNILSHKRVQCSVISANSLSIQESIFHGVPFVAIVTRPEERYFAQRVAEGNYGISMDLTTFTGPLFKLNLQGCLSNNSLRNRIQQIQNSPRNQQKNPALQTATWWVKQIAENPQTNDHLRSNHNSDSLSYIAENSLDVIAILQLFLVMCIINTIIVFRQTVKSFKKVSKSKKEKSKTEAGKKTKKSKAKTS